MYNYNNLFSQHFQDIMKQHSESMERIVEPLLNLQNSPAFVELQKNLQGLSRTAESIALKNQEAFAHIADLNNLTGLKALSEQMELIGEGLLANISVDLVSPLLKDLQSSFNGLDVSEEKLIRALEEVEQTDFVRKFESKVSNVEKGHSTAQGVSIGLNEVLTFLMLILMLIQTYDNSTDKELEQLSDSQDITNQLLQRLVELNSNTPELINKSKSGNRKLLIVKESVPLQSLPDLKSDTLTSLFKGQHLDLLEEKEDWYKVQFFDVAKSEVDTGWIQKKYIVPEFKLGQVQTKKLGDVANYVNGRAFKPKEWKNEGLPIIRIQNLNDESAPFNYSDQEHKEKYLVKNGDLLFAWSASLGAYIWKGGDAWLNQHIFRVDHDESINKKYLYYCLTKVVDELYAKSHGSGMVHVTKGKFEETEIQVPPLPTQNRIVEKIEELFSELDNGVENLQKAQQQLKTYRQAVLKDAFEGKLTKEWREQQDDLSTPEELLEQIKDERKAHRERELAEWEKEVEQWEMDGKSGSKPRKPSKSKKILTFEVEEIRSLSSLPEIWSWIRLGNLSNDIQIGPFGSLLHKSDYIENGIPVINPSNIKNEKILPDQSITISREKFSDLKKYKLTEGDVIIGRRGEMGRSALVTNKENGWLCGTGSLFLKLNDCSDSSFITKYVRSKLFKDYLNNNARGTTMKNLNATILANSPIPLLSRKEQNKIVNEIESRLSVVDQLEQTINENLQKAEALRQSILKKAFGGKLIQ